MDKYTSITRCLSDWEFCPLCSKRASVSVDFYASRNNYITRIDNKEIQVISPETGTVIYGIQLYQNSVLPEYSTKTRPTYIRICCKNLHWGINYDIKVDTQAFISLEINKLSFFLKDKKTQIFYNFISNYLNNETIITLSNDIAMFQELKQELIELKNFNKKYLIKKIRALCLLG